MSLVRSGARPAACWDLAAVHRLLTGRSRDDAAAIWAATHDLPEPPIVSAEPTLLDAGGGTDGPLGPDGQLGADWQRGGWRESSEGTRRWAELALASYDVQRRHVLDLPDPRLQPRQPPLRLLTAHAESVAALLAVELELDGLPLNRSVMTDLIAAIIGPRPADDSHAAAQRRARDEAVLGNFPAPPVDLRNPAQVRELLLRIGLDVPDTRSWRLEPHAASLPAVAALLAWRKAERISTTYGWSWLDNHVGADDRLRGAWSAAEGAGRMAAQAGLHNMPAELRSGVRADDGWVLVRADLGQVEPRVLAVVSADQSLAEAARADDMYAPVAAALGCDRPTAKVAVLAAMYGQTSGAAGAALRDMDRAYPRAMACLRDAEQAGRDGIDIRTYGGRLLRLARSGDDERFPASAWGRFARNAMVQGAAAELFKAWAGTVRAGLAAARHDGHIVLCLHDELLLHVPEAQAGDTVALVRHALDATAHWWASGSGVRFVADVGVAHSWAAAH
ncbi:MAG TPA: DNA polymerase [Mycobacteriales bacterium]|nr:DNA polymerase [Mycobacteriales bacterium]